MNEPFVFSLSTARRVLYTMIAAVLVIVTLPVLKSGSAYAVNPQQLQSRSITMSDSSFSGGSIVSGIGSGSNVTYFVEFTTSSNGPAGSMVIDFCSQSPIINETCTAPAGFNASSASLNAGAVTPPPNGSAPGTPCSASTVQTGTDNWAVTDSTGQVKLADDNTGGAQPTHDMQASTTECFTLSGITNPSQASCTTVAGPLTTNECSFYARIYTYTNNNWTPTTGSGYASPTSIGVENDYGGIALSTTNPITVSATVQEQLTFCVTSTDPNGGTPWNPAPQASTDGCGATNLAVPSVVLGHGSPTIVLDANGVYDQPVFTDLSTNATHGVVVNMRSSNSACTSPNAGGLSADNDVTCQIPPVGSTPGASGPWAITAGTAAFGLFVASDAVTGAGTVGAVNGTADYNDTSHTTCDSGGGATGCYYGMDTGSGNDGSVVGPYGSTVATSASPVFNAFDQYWFAATASLTTPAGIYTDDLSLIATGTY